MEQQTKRIPHYMQIRTFVTDRIHQQLWREGDRVPSENDLASQFGVSRITVKNALDNLVKEGLIYRIQGKGTFVSVSGGEPALYKKDLVASQPLVAYITPFLNNSFTARLLSGIEEELSQKGHKVIISISEGSLEKEKQLIQESLALGVRGILVFPVDGEKYNEEIIQLTMSGFPIVLIDRDLPGLSTYCVCSDHAGGAYAATRHLIQMGHKSIAFLSASVPFTGSTEERLAGYEKALADASMPILHHYRLQITKLEDIVIFLEQNPEITAVFAENAGVGNEVFEAASMKGISIPEQLSITFFDDFDYPNLAVIPPTVVVQQEQNIGRESAKLLLTVMNNTKHEKQKVLLPTKLLQRNSTGAPPNSEKIR